MNSLRNFAAIILSFTMCAFAQTQPVASLRGVVTDPSGALVPGALVQLRGPGGEQRATTDISGQYSFPSLRPGRYLVRVIVQGFSVSQKANLEITSPTSLDVQLAIAAGAQVVNVEDEAGRVGTDPASNASAIVLGEKELEALSDDPDELMQQLQAMAGPASGPNGGQIYIDGFGGRSLPAKSSIREVRINSNPLSPEYDKPGFGRVEIFTKPGTDKLRGQAFIQYNKEALNSRSPLLAQATRPPYQQRFYGLSLTGPIKKQKASFGFDFERRSIDENAFIYATALDANLNVQNINQGIVTPQMRTTITPRLDYMINPGNTLVVRYQDTRVELDKEGAGGFSLASKAYDQKNTENTVQLTETAVLSAKTINETRFQYMRTKLSNSGDNSIPAISVQGAFDGGGPQIGNSGNTNQRWELTNMTTRTHGALLQQLDQGLWPPHVQVGSAAPPNVSRRYFGEQLRRRIHVPGPKRTAARCEQPADSKHEHRSFSARSVPPDPAVLRAGAESDPGIWRRRDPVPAQCGRGGGVRGAVRYRPVRERRLAAASEPLAQLRPAIRGAN